jgi:hypothetical protein
LREAVLITGVAGVVASTAAAGLIPTVLTAALALTVPFAWISGIAGVGAAVALPFFQKLYTNKTLRKKVEIKQHKRKSKIT